MTNLSVRIPKRPRSPSPEMIQAYTPKNGTPVELRPGSPVGQGAYGKVYSATCRDGGQFVIKRPSTTSRFRHIEECRESLRNEKEVYDHLGEHEHIVGYHAGTPRGSLVMKRISKNITEEVTVIKEIPAEEARTEQTLSLIAGMLKALLHLRKQDYTHNDAHINNWMINPPKDVKLIDFGMATPCKEEGLVHYSEMLRAKKRGMLLYRKQHPVKTVQQIIAETGTETNPAMQKISSELKKIFSHDLMKIVHERREKNPSQPSRRFYRQIATEFLSDINRATGEMLEPKSKDEVTELAKELFEYRNLRFAKGETAQILENLLHDPSVFPQPQ